MSNLSQLMGVPGEFYSAPSQMCSSSPCRMRWRPRLLLHQTLRRKRKMKRIWVIHEDSRTEGYITGQASGKRGAVPENRKKEIILCRDDAVMLIFLTVSLSLLYGVFLSSSSRVEEEGFEEPLSYRRQRNKQAEEELHHISEKLSHRLEELDQVCVCIWYKIPAYSHEYFVSKQNLDSFCMCVGVLLWVG